MAGCVALALSGCAAWLPPPQTAALHEAAPVDLPRRAELREVPFFPQTPYHCGPAALATVLTQAGLPSGPDQLAGDVFLPAREGSLQVEMLAAARRRGAVATRLPPRLDALLREVAAGHPTVVLLNLGLAWLPRWHYAVLVGYDLDADQLVLRSGVTERELMPLATFEYTWARADRWAFVVTQPGELPWQATEADATQAVLGFERVATPDRAAKAWTPLTQRWPNALLPWMGLGNARFAQGDWDGAAAAFEQAAQQHDSAAAWNNLAQTLDNRGDRDGARVAVERGLERARKSEPQWLDALKATAQALR